MQVIQRSSHSQVGCDAEYMVEKRDNDDDRRGRVEDGHTEEVASAWKIFKRWYENIASDWRGSIYECTGRDVALFFVMEKMLGSSYATLWEKRCAIRNEFLMNGKEDITSVCFTKL